VRVWFVVLAGCVVAPESYLVHVGGHPHLVSYEQLDELRARAAHDHAAEALACPTVTTTAIANFFLATGCDRRVLYLATKCRHADMQAELVFEPVSGEPLEATACVGAGFESELHEVTALNEQGARDLDCPRADVIASFAYAGPKASPIPVAEGCGRRATYLPGSIRLASVVPIR
jgi:hypothetical protein